MRKHHIRRMMLGASAGPITLIKASTSLSDPPDDVRDGDLLVVGIQVSTSSFSRSGAFNELFLTKYTFPMPNVTVQYKVLQAREKTYDAPVNTNQGYTPFCSWWRNVDTSTPFDATYQVTELTDDPPSITTVTNNAVALVYYNSGDGDDAGADPSEPSGYTRTHRLATSFSESVFAYKNIPTAGAENPGAFQDCYLPGTYGVSHTLALRPKYPSA